MKDKMKSILSSMDLPTDNCTTRVIMRRKGGSVYLFKDNLNKGDFYFIPLKENKKDYYEGRLTIYVIKEPTEGDFEKVPNSKDMDIYGVKLEDCIKIYDDFSEVEKQISSAEDGSKVSANSLSARDMACLQLKVPSSSQEWLNNLIIESLERE